MIPEGRYSNHSACTPDGPCMMNNLKTTIPSRSERRGLYRQYSRFYMMPSYRSRTGQPEWIKEDDEST